MVMLQLLHAADIGYACAGDTVHLLHVVPEPIMIHVWPGMYVPPDDDAEKDEVTVPEDAHCRAVLLMLMDTNIMTKVS